jgi:hypothetical protein
MISISRDVFVGLLLCVYVFSSDPEIQSYGNEPVIIADGSFVARDPIIILAHINHRTVKCFQGPICNSLVSCLRSSKLVNCK